MKKRILASLLSLVLALSLAPMSTLAAEENDLTGSDPVPVCTCETLCTAEDVNMECPICAENVANCMGTAPADEPEEPVVPTVEEQLAELIAALPDPADIDPLDEEQVAAVNDQVEAIYAFAKENGLDVENDETINAVIAVLYPMDHLEGNIVWDRENTLSEDLIVNQGETLTIIAKITISGDVTISGGGTIQRGENYRGELISVPTGANLTLQNVTIDGGADTAAKLTSDEAAIRIEGGTAVLNAGAVIQNNNHVSTEDNPYLHASKPRYYNMGGGIAVYGGTLTMNEGSEVKNNAVTNTNYAKGDGKGNSDSLGGGVAIYENGVFIMNGGEISGNSAAVNDGEGRAFGGGVGLMTRGENAEVSNTPDDYKIAFHMDGGTISNNSAANGGGGIYGGVDQGDNESHRHTHLDMTVASTICENTSYTGGGGIQVGSADLEIKDGADISSNTAVSGGGLQVGSASYFTMSGGAVSNNTASGNKNAYGGGIYFSANKNSQLSITGGEIRNNSAAGSGGGIQIGTDLTASIANCTIQGNSCGNQESSTVASGGGIQANPGVVLNLADCSITENKSTTGHGGGIHISGPNKTVGGTVKITGTTIIQDNQSALTGPNMYVETVISTMDLSNLSKPSRIGVTWNVNGVDESSGTKVIDGVTGENYPCIVYEPNEDQYYVLRKSEDTAILHKALHLTLHSISPVTEKPIEGVQHTVLGLVGETVNFTELCGFEVTGYHIDRWATNYVGQEGYLWNNPYTFSDSFESDTARGGPNAIWVPDTYTITYELNGGTAGGNAPDTHTYGTTTTLIAPTRTGYTFNGWFTDQDFSGTKVDSLAGDGYTSDIVLYAQWTPNTYTISFNGGNGASGSTASVTATYDQPAALTANGFTMAGKNFAGWASTQENANDGTVEYSDQTEVLNLAESGTVTLYAVWTDKQVLDPDLTDTVVTYNGNPQKFHVDGGYAVQYYQNRNLVTDPTNAGIYDVEITRAEDETYAAYHGRVMGGLVINKAPMIVKADDQSIRVGNELPEFTYTVTGLVNGETLNTEPTLTCDADGKAVGSYAIQASGADAGSNYTITYVDGTLTVSRRSSGGGSSSSTEYAITVDDGKNGSVSASPKRAEKGDTVTITVKPDAGYELDELTVTDKSGDEIKLTEKADNKFSFKMPASKVTVEASFKLIETEPENPFTDISESDYFYDAVLWAADKGITSGVTDTLFAPNSSCTRAQMVTFLWRANGSPAVDYAMSFTDVPADAYYADAVRWAVSEGITSGTSETTFAPDMTVTRAQTVTFLYRAAGTPAVYGGSFTDVDANAYYANAVAWAVSEDITSGTGATTFSPDAPCTRAQIVTFLYRDAK